MLLPLKMVHKIFFAIFGGIALTIALMAGMVYWSINQGFLKYTNRLEQESLKALLAPLQQEYAQENTWDMLFFEDYRWRNMIKSYYLPLVRPGDPKAGFQRKPPKPLQRGDSGFAGEGPQRNLNRKGSNLRGPGRKKRDREGRKPGKRKLGKAGRPLRAKPGMANIGSRVYLYDERGEIVFGRRDLKQPETTIPIMVNSVVVGTLGIAPRRKITSDLDTQFIKSQMNTLFAFVMLLLLFAIFISVLLARHWGGRLQKLTHGAQALSKGAFDTRVSIKGRDEMAQLATNFNNLAHTLGENQLARQRWTAEISHELRTPIAIFKGELEALQDGVRTYRPEMLDSLLSEVSCLAKLVDDLYELSRADLGGLGYRKESIDVCEVLSQVFEAYEGRFTEAGLSMTVAWPVDRRAVVFADSDRLFQLFANLLENSLKYTYPGGTIRIRVVRVDSFIRIKIADSAPGLAQEATEKMFDHFFRGPAHQTGHAKGSGLGLAIAKNIVTAHEGQITAEPSDIGGILVQIDLPLERS